MSAPRASTIRRLREHLLSSDVLPEAGHLLVAVSGGVDSMALLHALRFHCDNRWRVSAAHLDHAMRDDSAAVAEWVRGVCTAWRVPLHLSRCARVPSAEAEARRVRYRFLARARRESGAACVLTAHHADDQAETVLLRMARGTGLDGLAGIRPRRGRLLRPLLELPQAALADYARDAALRWKEDPTNHEVRFSRNRVRHEVLPALERVQQGAAGHIARLAALAGRERSAWGAVVQTVLRDMAVDGPDGPPFVLARERVLAYHPVVRARVLRSLARQCGAHLDRVGTARALAFITRAGSGTSLELRGGLRLHREFDTIRLTAGAAAGPAVPLRIGSAAAGRGSWQAGDATWAVYWTPGEGLPGTGTVAKFDPSLLRFPLEIRAWHHGDRIRLGYGTKKVSRLFQERRVGRSERTRRPILADAYGRVLWVPGLAQAADTAPAGGPVFHIMVADGDSL